MSIIPTTSESLIFISGGLDGQGGRKERKKISLDSLELINAVHALGLLLRVHETAERGLELLAAGPVRHAAQTGTVPVDLARLGVEGALLVGLLL